MWKQSDFKEGDIVSLVWTNNDGIQSVLAKVIEEDWRAAEHIIVKVLISTAFMWNVGELTQVKLSLFGDDEITIL